MKCNVLYVYCVRHIIYCNNVIGYVCTILLLFQGVFNFILTSLDMTNAIGYALGHAAMSGDVSRAAWNSAYEKGLVEILHEYKDNPKYKGQNGWSSEGWRIIIAKFNESFPIAHFTKQQIQEKEKELKGNYRTLRDAKKESGNGWNESLCMILAEPKIWEKLIKVSYLVYKI